MLTLTRRLPPDPTVIVDLTLSLSAEERTRSRHHFHTPDGQSIYLQLPRGTVLQDGDLLLEIAAEAAQLQRQVRIIARPEPVLTVTAATPLDLLRAAYHLGNRHVPLEVAPTYLRLSPDPVLQDLLQKMGLTCVEEVVPFQPEAGAYGHSVHDSSHPH